MWWTCVCIEGVTAVGWGNNVVIILRWTHIKGLGHLKWILWYLVDAVELNQLTFFLLYLEGSFGEISVLSSQGWDTCCAHYEGLPLFLMDFYLLYLMENGTEREPGTHHGGQEHPKLPGGQEQSGFYGGEISLLEQPRHASRQGHDSRIPNK